MLQIDVDSPVPPYDQIRTGLATRIGSGDLAVGTRLPPVRALAAELGVAVNTVARAYRELEAAGLVETRGRGGTVVRAATGDVAERLHAAAHAYVTVARALGTDDAHALDAVRVALRPGGRPV